MEEADRLEREKVSLTARCHKDEIALEQLEKGKSSYRCEEERLKGFMILQNINKWQKKCMKYVKFLNRSFIIYQSLT